MMSSPVSSLQSGWPSISARDLARLPVPLASCRRVAVADGRVPCVSVELLRPGRCGSLHAVRRLNDKSILRIGACCALFFSVSCSSAQLFHIRQQRARTPSSGRKGIGRLSVYRPIQGCSSEAVHWKVRVIKPTCAKLSANSCLSRGGSPAARPARSRSAGGRRRPKTGSAAQCRSARLERASRRKAWSWR